MVSQITDSKTPLHVNINLSESQTNCDQESAFDDVEEEENGFSIIGGNTPRKGLRQDHTVQLGRLPEDVTYKEITNIVRGGRLVEVYLRLHDRAADVTFADEVEAAGFLSYARRNDIYVRTKRVSTHVAGSLAIDLTSSRSKSAGASANSPSMTDFAAISRVA